MLNIWSAKTGYVFKDPLGNNFQERQVLKNINGLDRRIPLPLLNTADLTNVSFSLISGSLPAGLRLEGHYIVGSTYEVSQTTTSTFVIRATKVTGNVTEVADRTFKIIVDGPDAPNWVTPEGTLPVGAIPERLAKIVSAVRTNNVVTLNTESPHKFIFGNAIEINVSDSSINSRKAIILRPPLNGDTADEYKTRIASTITYRIDSGDATDNFALKAVTGTVSLVKSPLAFVLDGTFIDFQLQATDTDLRAGDELEFFIEQGNGTLPPGLSMDRHGKITGFISPILDLDISARDGTFDANTFDGNPYDFGILNNIGIADYEQVMTPKKLNRFYEFTVSVSDGETVSKRTFKIYVVGDDFLRTDNTILKIGSGVYTSDATYLRSPVWITGSNLGIKRANNYVTAILDTYDPNPAIGPVDYKLESLNPDGSISELPPGLTLDGTNCEIFGFVPYQPAVTLEYKFTISAVKYDKENIESVEVSIVSQGTQPLGQKYMRINKLPVEDQSLIINDTFRLGAYVYEISNYEVTDQEYDILRLDQPLNNFIIDGYVISKTYYRKLSQTYTTRKSPKTFTMQVLGEVDSVINWITPSALGNVRANLSSQLGVQAVTQVSGAVLTYQVTSGTLPPGIELVSNGELIGQVTQFGNIVYRSYWRTGTVNKPVNYKINDVVKYKNNGTITLYKCTIAHSNTGAAFSTTLDKWELYTFRNNIKGLTTFDRTTTPTTFDGLAGTLDRSYRFTILAQDQYKYSAISRTFSVFVEDPDVKLFSNVYVKPFPSLANRQIFNTFINDLDIFTQEKIYRSSDPNFGVQKELKMLIYAGIETLDVGKYVPALSTNTKRKRFRIGSPKKAVAKNQGSNEVIYEVIYLEVFDEYEIGQVSAAQRIKPNIPTRSKVKINQTNLNPANGFLGTVANGNGDVTYQTTKIRDSLNADAVDRYRPVGDVVKASSTAIKASGNDIEYIYPSSVTNIRNNIRTLMLNGNSPVRQIDTENSFLPPWMITPQSTRTPATGYIKAIPLCYCKAGEADYILENIANSGFDFTSIDFEVDRFIIDSVSGSNEDQYLKFPTYKYNV
jgi:hypothetical protein